MEENLRFNSAPNLFPIRCSCTKHDVPTTSTQELLTICFMKSSELLNWQRGMWRKEKTCEAKKERPRGPNATSIWQEEMTVPWVELIQQKLSGEDTILLVSPRGLYTRLHRSSRKGCEVDHPRRWLMWEEDEPQPGLSQRRWMCKIEPLGSSPKYNTEVPLQES